MKHTLDRDLSADLHTAAKVVVVGSGAGGGVAAKELAEAGHDVILLEAGPYFEARDFSNDTWTAIRMLYYEMGMRAMIGKSVIPTMQARAVGGTTLVNSGICFRLPDWIYEEWHEGFGLNDYTPEMLTPSFDRVQEVCHIHQTPQEILGRYDLALKRGCDALGYSNHQILRNVKDCVGCGICQYGCPYDAHLGTDMTYVPRAIEAGCRLYANARVDRVLTANGAVSGVSGVITDAETSEERHRFEISADAVVLAAGVMANPLIWFNSDLPDRHSNVGRHLTNHPGIGIIAMMPHRTDIGISVPQGWASGEFRREGIMFETLGMPVEVAAARTPLWGRDYQSLLARYHYMAMWGVMCRAQGTGRVKRGSNGRPKISYDLTPADLKTLARGLKLTAEIAFAAGAESVIPGVRGMPKVIHGADQASLFDALKMKSNHLQLIGNHPMGTCRMGADPRSSVVNPDCESHEVKNLFVMDASVLPTNLGVNPMWTIMALADCNARKLAARLN